MISFRNIVVRIERADEAPIKDWLRAIQDTEHRIQNLLAQGLPSAIKSANVRVYVTEIKPI